LNELIELIDAQVRKQLAAAKFAQAKLPPRMEIHKEAEQEKAAKNHEVELPPFKPQGRMGYVPNFDELHSEFQEQLLNAKKAAQVRSSFHPNNELHSQVRVSASWS
jgi:hypothetical protein